MLARHPDEVTVVRRMMEKQASADVVVYDVFGLTDGSGSDLKGLVEARDTSVVVLTHAQRPDLWAVARRLGAQRALADTTDEEHLIAAVEKAGRRRSPDEPTDGAGLGHEFVADLRGTFGLTPRELDVLLAIAQGLSNQEIAHLYYLSINSVKTYIRSAYRRIEVTSRSQAVVWCFQHGFPV